MLPVHVGRVASAAVAEGMTTRAPASNTQSDATRTPRTKLPSMMALLVRCDIPGTRVMA